MVGVSRLRRLTPLEQVKEEIPSCLGPCYWRGLGSSPKATVASDSLSHRIDPRRGLLHSLVCRRAFPGSIERLL